MYVCNPRIYGLYDNLHVKAISASTRKTLIILITPNRLYQRVVSKRCQILAGRSGNRFIRRAAWPDCFSGRRAAYPQDSSHPGVRHHTVSTGCRTHFPKAEDDI